MKKKVVLIILDGWGIATNPNVSAIDKAKTPFIDSLYKKYPNGKLEASGLAVGLPAGQMGNSEVGHMNIGAGRVVYQDLVKVNQAILDRTLDTNPVLVNAIEYAKAKGVNFHLGGLISDGGVHSHIEHVKGLIKILDNSGIKNFFIHGFTDGRDTDPMGGYDYIKEVEQSLEGTGGKIASIVGRYYSMDRDNRWERIKLAYDLIVKGKGKASTDLLASIKESYAENVTDEFILPIVKVDAAGKPIAIVKEGDVFLYFNFRTDRGRQLTQALTQTDFPEFDMKKLDLNFVTLTNYDDRFLNVKTIFEKDNLNNTLGEIIAKNGLKQVRIAETEKYPHVTFFFSGGRETSFDGEKRILCPSPKVATYDLKPEMSANEIKDNIVEELKKQETDFVCLNFANPDMVGHTGVFQAAVIACETVDKCAEAVVETAKENGYTCILIADHGNADMMINDDGSPNTAHTTNLVPFIVVDDAIKTQPKNGKLGDLAPTILTLMGLEIPKEMTGTVLL
jgi:2,3-bisphosphoglycerate-independent phosphoglycerate mutase